MYDDILLPTDGSDSSAAVVDHAAAIASDRDATVHVLYVVDDRAFLTLADDLRDDVREELEAEAATATAAAREALESRGIEVTTTVREGDPAEEILATIAEEGIDLVTMGTHGANYRQNMVGSVSARVVAEASVPVLTVRVDEGDGENGSGD
ncbi:MAG: universal stress protein [Haloferacaceae archaeon]